LQIIAKEVCIALQPLKGRLRTTLEFVIPLAPQPCLFGSARRITAVVRALPLPYCRSPRWGHRVQPAEQFLTQYDIRPTLVQVY